MRSIVLVMPELRPGRIPANIEVRSDGAMRWWRGSSVPPWHPLETDFARTWLEAYDQNANIVAAALAALREDETCAP